MKWMKQVFAVFRKFCMNAFRNTSTLIIFFVIPFSVYFLKILDIGDSVFFVIFFPLHQIIAGTFAAGYLIAEEREKNTLCVLFRSGVHPVSYLLAAGLFCVVFIFVGDFLLYAAASIKQVSFPELFLLSLGGAFCSVLIGYVYGMVCSTQHKVNIYIFPAIFVLGVFPVLGLENKGVAALSKFFFTQELFDCLTGQKIIYRDGMPVTFINILLLLGVVCLVYHGTGFGKTKK